MPYFGDIEAIEPKIVLRFTGTDKVELTREEAEGLALYILNDVLGLSYGEVPRIVLTPESYLFEQAAEEAHDIVRGAHRQESQAEADAKVERLVREMAAAKFASFEPAPNGTG